MMTIIKIENGEITGWLIGTDTHDLRRQCDANWESDVRDLAQILYQMEFPSTGKHDLGNGFTLLVS